MLSGTGEEQGGSTSRKKKRREGKEKHDAEALNNRTRAVEHRPVAAWRRQGREDHQIYVCMCMYILGTHVHTLEGASTQPRENRMKHSKRGGVMARASRISHREGGRRNRKTNEKEEEEDEGREGGREHTHTDGHRHRHRHRHRGEARTRRGGREGKMRGEQCTEDATKSVFLFLGNGSPQCTTRRRGDEEEERRRGASSEARSSKTFAVNEFNEGPATHTHRHRQGGETYALV